MTLSISRIDVVYLFQSRSSSFDRLLPEQLSPQKRPRKNIFIFYVRGWPFERFHHVQRRNMSRTWV